METGPKKIPIASCDYSLPEERIAQYPLEQRDHSKIVIFRDDKILEDRFHRLGMHLPPDGVMIFNETRVVHARLLFQKKSGSQVEIFCLEPRGNIRDYQFAFRQREASEWECLVGNSKRWKEGILADEISLHGGKSVLQAERLEKYESTSLVRFTWSPLVLTFSEIIEIFGKVPLPPYINRQAEELDADHYQTVYARQDGSVAAPTAGLHFTTGLLEDLDKKGLKRLNFTLHVGAGTFRPVISKNTGGHDMHAEQVSFDLHLLEILVKLLDHPLILVGTTSVRMMESLYWHGVKLILGMTREPELNIRQWEPYEIGDAHQITRRESLEKVIEMLKQSGRSRLAGETRLMIVPGYRFRYPDILITNFHQPRSTLLLLISAFIGEKWRDVYQYALDHDFRFLSYGDGCLFFKS